MLQCSCQNLGVLFSRLEYNRPSAPIGQKEYNMKWIQLCSEGGEGGRNLSKTTSLPIQLPTTKDPVPSVVGTHCYIFRSNRWRRCHRPGTNALGSTWPRFSFHLAYCCCSAIDKRNQITLKTAAIHINTKGWFLP